MTSPTPNAAQSDAWNGVQGDNWVKYDPDFQRALAGFTPPLLDGANIGRGDAVLDVGCGSGRTTLEAARRTAGENGGEVVGLDISLPLLDLARTRASEQNTANVRFELGDAEAYRFESGMFDCIISRFGCLFFADTRAAFANLRVAARAGARLSLMIWQPLAENRWLLDVRQALSMGRVLPEPKLGEPGPFSLSDQEFVREILAEAGWSDIEFADVRPAYNAGPDVERAFNFLTGLSVNRALLEELTDELKIEASARLRRCLKDHLTGEGILFGAAGWHITARNP